MTRKHVIKHKNLSNGAISTGTQEYNK